MAMVQVATALPMFLFGLPAGALADIVEPSPGADYDGDQRNAVDGDVCNTGIARPQSRRTTFWGLFFDTEWPRHSWRRLGRRSFRNLWIHADLPPAVALDSVAVNISRAIGPALAGLFIAYLGMAAPFWFNVLSNLGVIGALIWWRDREVLQSSLPAERFGGAIRAGLRYALHNRHLQATLIRASGFFLFASAYWALLPLVARNQIDGGPGLYGILLGAIGAGAVAAAFVLPRMQSARWSRQALRALDNRHCTGARPVRTLASPVDLRFSQACWPERRG